MDLITLKFIQGDGAFRLVEATEGKSLMEAARGAKVDGIEAACGGSLACGTCHVHVLEPWFSRLDPPGEMEGEMLEYGIYIEPNSRLSCQIPLTADLDGLEVVVPPSQR